MKKRFIALFCLLITGIMLLSGCGPRNENIISTDNYVITQSENKKYFCVNIDSTEEYLNFLENFNENEYEIVDIEGFGERETSYYMITYRKISK